VKIFLEKLSKWRSLESENSFLYKTKSVED